MPDNFAKCSSLPSTVFPQVAAWQRIWWVVTRFPNRWRNWVRYRCFFRGKLSADKRAAQLKNRNQELEFLVGVAGAIGAGKTSLLNALLEFPKLLPSSNTEAATATVCRIAWNHDNTPGHEFTAEVIFRSKDDIMKELEEVLKAVQDRKELKEREFEGEIERCEAIEAATEIISQGISKVCAVWNLDESEIEDMDLTVESIPKDNEQTMDLLGKTITIFSSDADRFALEVKPYLDSTPTPEGITAWPLIEEVRLCVKSEYSNMKSS